MIILALDLATNTGFAWGPHDGRPTLGHFRLPSTGEDVGRFLCEFEDRLRPIIDSAGADLIVFEAPVLPRSKWNPKTKKVEGGVSIITTRKLQGLAGLVEMIAHRLGLPCFEVQPAEAKQALAGNGGAKKPQMVAAARAHGFDPHVVIQDGDETSDEADALAVFIATVVHRFPDLAKTWAMPVASAPLFAGAPA